MPFLPTDAFPVDFLPDGNVAPLAPVVWTGTRGDTVTIPAGRRSDLGTVPKLLRGLLPHDGKAARAFLVHDELCERIAEYQAALDAWDQAGRVGDPPPPPEFDAVDTDNVLRIVLQELGVGPVRWIYWEGVRAGALASRGRRAGWWRTIVPFTLLAPVAVLVILPAAAGTLLSRLLLALITALCWPFERVAARDRADKTESTRARALADLENT